MDRKFCGLYIEYIFEYIMNRLEKEEQIQVFSEESRLVKELIEKEIFQRCFKSLLYCMNVERLEGNLSGDNPEQRYTWFSEADYCITAMNKVFPSMKMQVYEEIEGKCKYILQVISLFKNNQQTICRCFFEKDTEEIVNIINGGDWHNDKCVLADKRKVLELYEFTKNTLIEILEYQTDPEMLSQQKRLINDSIVSSIALGIEYRDLKCIPTEQLCTEESKEFLRKNIDDNRIEGADGTISWIGLMVNDKEQLEYAILDWSLYSGLVGIGYMYISEYVSNADEINQIVYLLVRL